jgi:hypothetical protein
LKLFGVSAHEDPNAKIRLTAHQARFRESPKMYYFINVGSLSSHPFSITHVHYRDPDVSIMIQPASRPLPVLLGAGDAWATYVATERLPKDFRSDAYDKFIVRLATGEVYRSCKEDSILPEGSVPGGPIQLTDTGEDSIA